METTTPHDFSKYRWARSPEDPSHIYRYAGGSEVIEDVFHRFFKEQNLFLGITVELTVSIATGSFVDRARDAWIATRRIVPIIAGQTEYDANGKLLITYQVPKGDNCAVEWARRTVLLDTTVVDLDELRYEVGKKPIPAETGDQTFLYILPFSDTSYGLLMYTSHVLFDGVGTKVVMSLYLDKLAERITDPSLFEREHDAWGPEIDNLLPFVTDILAENEPIEGPAYQETLLSVMGDLAYSTSRAWGFKQRRIGPGATRRLGYKFSCEETTALLRAARSLQLMINHVAHAAIFLVCAEDNPPTAGTPKDAVLTSFGLVNARHRLRPPYNEKNGYPGYCLGMSPLFVPLSLVVDNADKSRREQLLALAGALKEKYQQQKEYPALLAVEPEQIDLVVAEMMCEPLPPPWMGPLYSGDGKGEDTLMVKYTVREKTIISITDFFQSLNKTDPGPFFRTYSWIGRLELSADYNEYAMPRDAIQKFMDKWIELVRLVL